MDRAVGIIPARWASSRFPGKAIAPLAGRPMLQWVWEGARRAKHLREVWIATDDARIAEVSRGFGAPVVMTSADHATGTDRIAEAARTLSDPIVVNVQGDEPTIEGFVIDAAVEALCADPEALASTVVRRATPEARDDPNRVKVVLDREGRALYFSRSPIPYTRATAPEACWEHVGLYAYRRDFLLRLADLPQTPAERAERLEQLRILEHGHAIRVAVVDGWQSAPVDVPDDLPRAEALLATGRGGTPR